MVISKKPIIFQGLRGGPTFSGGGGSNFFQGVQMIISIETHITFDCAATQTEENSHCFHWGTTMKGDLFSYLKK